MLVARLVKFGTIGQEALTSVVLEFDISTGFEFSLEYDDLVSIHNPSATSLTCMPLPAPLASF